MIGIYRIKNIINGKSYYGSSKNIEKRWKSHINGLNKNSHINSLLQRSWNKYGSDNFIFEVIEECEESLLLEREQHYLNFGPEYNIGLKSSGGDNITKHPNRSEIVKKITESVKKRFDSMSEDDRKKFSKPMESNPNWRGGVSYIYCECGKRIGYGHKYCNRCTPRYGENNPFFGKTHSESTKVKSSKRMMGVYKGDQNKPIIIDGIEYSSLGNASKQLNISSITIRWRVLSKNPKYKNYHYKGDEKIFYSKEEQKERLSEPQIGKKTNFNKPFLIDGVEYRTLKEASEKLNIHQMTIKGRLQSPNFNNYKYKD
jgi:group I intron endonuclease